MRGLILLLSLLPLVFAWFGRHVLWTRARAEGLRIDCGMTVASLRERLGLPAIRRVDGTDAATLGNALREAGLELLERDGDTLAKARRKGLWLTRILPVLVIFVAVLGMFARRIPPGVAITGATALVALWTVLRLSGLSIELRAVARASRDLQKGRYLRRAHDEEAVMTAAKASIWTSVWPW